MPQSRTRKNKKKKHATPRRRPADDLRQVAQLVVYTGLRESEVIRLNRTDVDLDTGKMSTRVVADTTVEAYEALHHLETLLQETIARGGHEAQPMDEATARAEQRQVFRIGTLVRPGTEWACDWPYHESGVNAVGGQSYSLVVTTPEGERRVVADGDDWDGLFADASRTAADQPFWARPLGARQRVFDHALAWRSAVGAEPLDAQDVAVGAADFPFLGPAYLLAWFRANPEEVAANHTAMKLVRADKEFGLARLLADLRANPVGLPSVREDSTEDEDGEDPEPPAAGYRVRTGKEVRAAFATREKALADKAMKDGPIGRFDDNRARRIAAGDIVIHPDGSETQKMTPSMEALLRLQEEKFQFKFGRPIGQRDPIFFDEDADTPQAEAEDTDDVIAAVRQAAIKVGGVDPDAAVEAFMGREALADYKKRRQS